jgi:hypothetical protein
MAKPAKKTAVKKPAKKVAKKAVKKPKTKLKYYFTVKDSVKVVQDRAGPKANKRVKFVFSRQASPCLREGNRDHHG